MSWGSDCPIGLWDIMSTDKMSADKMSTKKKLKYEKKKKIPPTEAGPLNSAIFWIEDPNLTG